MYHQPVPDKEDDQRADHGADKAGALVLAVPTDRLPDPGRDECPGNAEQRGENETRRVVRARRQHAGDDTGDKADDDDPENVHGDLRARRQLTPHI